MEFTNDSNSLAIGYSCWLKPQLDDSDIKTTITHKNEVIIQWPEVNIMPAKGMKNLLMKNSSIEWKEHTIHILAFGSKFIIMINIVLYCIVLYS